MKAKVSISRRGNSKAGDGISISIKDGESRLRICEITMSLAEFAEAITGLGECEAAITEYPNAYAVERYGKQKTIEHAYCDKFYDKERQASEVRLQFAEYWEPQGWEMWSDGLSTQQPTTRHQFMVCRYDEVEE